MSAEIYRPLLDRMQQKHSWDIEHIWEKKRWHINYPPATEEQLRTSEAALGFPFPPLLRAIYLQIANGGVGPRRGIMGAMGGFVDNMGNIVEMYLWRKQEFQPIDLAECEKQAYETSMKAIPFRHVSNLEMEPPIGTWPEDLLDFYHYGCGDFSSIDIKTGRIFVGGNPYLWYEANSLEEWLERWLTGDFYPAEREGDTFSSS